MSMKTSSALTGKQPQLPSAKIEKSISTLTFKHLGFSSRSYSAATGVHCSYKIKTQIVSVMMQLTLSEYIKIFCPLDGLRSRDRRHATASFGIATDIISGIFAIMLSLVAFDVAGRPM